MIFHFIFVFRAGFRAKIPEILSDKARLGSVLPVMRRALRTAYRGFIALTDRTRAAEIAWQLSGAFL